jgi:phage shock protein A
MSALFSGDLVQTEAGSALIQSQSGPRVVLGIQSQASFSSSRVELQKGLMSFRTEAGGPLFAASTLRIEPIEAKSAANVTYLDHKATVAVTEGSFRVVDPSGAQLASLRAGEARLFEEVAASEPAPPSAAASPAAPAAPQIGGGGSNRSWLLALGVGLVGTSLAIAALLRASDADDRADEASAAANEVRAQTAALLAQINALQGQLASIQATSSQQASTIANLQAQLDAAKAELLSAQANISSSSQTIQNLQNTIAQLQQELETVKNSLVTLP